MPPTRVHRSRALAAGLAAVALIVVPGARALADPTVPEIEAQISKLCNQAEPLIEK